MNPADSTRLVRRIAAGVGFDLVGVTSAAAPARAEHYKAWLGRGYAGSMRYLHRYQDLRSDPAQLLPGACSIICVAVAYRREDEPDGAPETGRIAQYARGRDYHVTIRRMLMELTDRLRASLDTPFDARPFIDTGPVLERELAERAGLGWVGKNTLLLNPRLGSWVLLGELVTTLALEPDAPMTDHCGTCTRCLDACPTNAFPSPYVLDASRCISYLTIERRLAVPPDLAGLIGDWVYGCDVCQDVCPFTPKAELGTNSELMEDRLPARIPLKPLTTMTSGDYRRLTRDSAARRATRPMWIRNAKIALRNISGGDPAE
ncbi:MAG: tRNA epoxyqueuosine(34) reductase QueG [Phycisphaerales bacterium]|nr:tRNA epoxyqueuosine(34) reductase QueG [Phycisphaerales bacterium]